jgi:hypothetical protein
MKRHGIVHTGKHSCIVAIIDWLLRKANFENYLFLFYDGSQVTVNLNRPRNPGCPSSPFMYVVHGFAVSN